MNKAFSVAILFTLSLFLLFGCASPLAGAAAGANQSGSNAAGQSAPNANPSAPGAGASPSAPNASISNPTGGISMAKNPVVVFETNKGVFKAEIFVNEAPITGNNFMKLVRAGFYENLTFHRVEPDFVVQGGDPKGDGTGGSGQNIPLEIKPNLKHVYGSLGMARANDPNSASSQFYVVTGPASFLDGQYAVFGKVLGTGMDVVTRIRVGDRMTKVYEEKS